MHSSDSFHFHSLDEVRREIAFRRLDLRATEDISPLFEAVQVGEFRLPNRLVVLPMEGADGTPEGAPDELTFRRYKRFAAGGAGLLWVEATAVVEEGRANPRQLWLRKRTVPGFAALVEATLKAAREAVGPNHRPVLVVQLTHSGRYSKPGRAPRPIIAHHSPYLDPLHNLPQDYPLITDEELEHLEDEYVEAARCAREAGFDAVDVKACHRYLVSELHASYTRENSRYGGSFENRTRFFRNVVTKIRQAVPGLIVTSRMNAYDAMAYPYGFGVDKQDPSKPDPTEPIELVRFLRSSGAPVVNITIGNPYYNPYVNRPYDLPIVGSPVSPEHPLMGVARFVSVVRQIQAAVPGLLVIGGGYSWLRHFFPHVAAAAVRDGWVSLVGIGRLAFAYPDFVRDLAEHGRLDPERVCVTCSACTQIMRDGGRAGCVPRDSAIYEPIYKAGRAEALDTIIEMAKTCRQCNDPTCVGKCPARVNIPEFVGHIAAGRFRDAYETLRRANVLAAVCGYVCPAETLCESACINSHYTQSVPIRHLQRWVSRKAVEEGWTGETRQTLPPSGKRVAVLGAGPAGISAAYTLALLGHAVTLFDKKPLPGGIAGETIPADRLPDSILRMEIQEVLRSSSNVNFRSNVQIGPACNLDGILAEGFDAVLIALGLNQSVPLPCTKRPVSGVIGGLEFLARVKDGEKVSGTVLVLGGGNTAIDASVAAKAAGAPDVSILYRRSFMEMPAWPQERERAIKAGINFLILTQPLEYITDGDGKLTGIKVIRTRLGEPGLDGRRSPKPVPGSEHVLTADLVVEAIGQGVSDVLKSALVGVEFNPNGLIRVEHGTFRTTLERVFAAGDIVNGGTTVVQAVAEGADAAHEMDRWLRR
jgi:NADPH-dependent glutamate synthase beta subunit-like oxidoreductase/2,4-dienoyl-CoA reductase-like NADH-dependent reductase (Old Yellow Enzyme family)